jgi:hypothetical protein
MTRATLKDSHFRTIGFIDTDANGKQTPKNAQFTMVGYYDPRTNWTVDSNFRLVSCGNTLSSLIRCK